MGVIQIHATMKAKPGCAEALADIFSKAVALTREHQGILNYQYYRGADGTFAILEGYKDAAALGAHMAGLGELGPAMMENIGEMSVSMFGPVPEEVKAGFAAMQPTYYDHFAGFTPGE